MNMIGAILQISQISGWRYLGSLLLTWLNFDNKWLHSQLSVVWNNLSIPKLHRSRLRINNFIPHLIIDVITYPCWD